MKKTSLTLTLVGLLFSIFPLTGQSLLESKGQMPDSFLNRKKWEIIKGPYNPKLEGEKLAQKLSKKSEFLTNDFLLGGNVMFGDPISIYLRNILENLLGPNAEEIEIYPYRSTSVNAFMTIDGQLFVSTGLISQVQNEAELAFVLAHELIHREKEHGVEGLLNTLELSRDFSYSSYEKEDLNNSYSKELELEADRLALEDILVNSDYSLDNAIDIFDVLLFSYLPFDEKKIDYTTLVPSKIDYPQEVFPKEEKPITAFEDYDDSKSSHPNIKKRKNQFLDIVSTFPKSENKKDFIQPKERFFEIQKLAQRETIIKSIRNEDYPRALFNSLVYLDSHPDDSLFVQQNIGFCIHAMAGYAEDDEFSKEMLKEIDENFEGQLYNTYYFFLNLSGKDLTILSTAYNYDLYKRDTTNLLVKNIYEKSLFELVNYYEVKFRDIPEEKFQAKKDTLSEEEYEKLSKLDKIRYKKSLTVKSDYFMIYALTDIRKDSLFIKDFKALELDLKKMKSEENFISLKDYRENQRYLDKDEVDLIGVDSIIVFTPKSYYLSNTRQTVLNIEKTEELRANILQSLSTCLDYYNANYEIIAPLYFNSDNVEAYNDYCKLKWWIDERISHGNVPIEMVTYNLGIEMAEKYNKRYILVTQLSHLKQYTLGGGLLFLGSVFLPTYLPVLSYNLVMADRHSFYLSYLIDLKTGNVLHVIDKDIETKTTPDFLNSIFFETSFQITTKPE